MREFLFPGAARPEHHSKGCWQEAQAPHRRAFKRGDTTLILKEWRDPTAARRARCPTTFRPVEQGGTLHMVCMVCMVFLSA